MVVVEYVWGDYELVVGVEWGFWIGDVFLLVGCWVIGFGRVVDVVVVGEGM